MDDNNFKTTDDAAQSINIQSPLAPRSINTIDINLSLLSQTNVINQNDKSSTKLIVNRNIQSNMNYSDLSENSDLTINNLNNVDSIVEITNDFLSAEYNYANATNNSNYINAYVGEQRKSSLSDETSKMLEQQQHQQAMDVVSEISTTVKERIILGEEEIDDEDTKINAKLITNSENEQLENKDADKDSRPVIQIENLKGK